MISHSLFFHSTLRLQYQCLRSNPSTLGLKYDSMVLANAIMPHDQVWKVGKYGMVWYGVTRYGMVRGGVRTKAIP